MMKSANQPSGRVGGLLAAIIQFWFYLPVAESV
jgi:hypothetical protein